ncbi:hypothetical protein AVEN_55613-1 [Araneus ventricosus]|uniref:Uncharacterized protein n=1 Tax=Araneus ventricosus TaxID=182803 RepID=A0A4Y2W9X8_ARAVE|nr:hypothetical protein AVEN_55613-1 [Araneus ventricosus]
MEFLMLVLLHFQGRNATLQDGLEKNGKNSRVHDSLYPRNSMGPVPEHTPFHDIYTRTLTNITRSILWTLVLHNSACQLYLYKCSWVSDSLARFLYNCDIIKLYQYGEVRKLESLC